MQGPAFLPSELAYCEAFATEEELACALMQKPTDLVSFFELACADETWCEQRTKLIRILLRWAAKKYYLTQLPLPYAQRIVGTVQKHYAILEPLLFFRAALFFNICLIVDKQSFWINSFLFGVASPFFTEIFKVQAFNHLRQECTLPNVSISLFRLVEEHILKGEIADLWSHSYDEVLSLMQQAKSWSLPLLVKECAFILKRYITKENVMTTLLQAHRQSFTEWKNDCGEVFNQQEWGLRFLKGREDELRIEFLNFKQETWELFQALAPDITHLAFGRSLSEEPLFKKIVEQCPKLIGISLSGSLRYHDQFTIMPNNLLELDLSACPWLNYQHMQDAGKRFYRLKELHLNSNSHLNYLTWGELNHFHQLTILHLAGCYQISNQDLKLISQNGSHWIELSLEECRNIEDAGLFNIIHYCPHLAILNIGYCQALTDRSLVELANRGYQLAHLSMRRCTSFSDQALLNLVRSRSALRFLDIRDCKFSLKLTEQIRQNYPLLTLVV